MIKIYINCLDCEYIDICEHPLLDKNGKPIDPEKCEEKIKIEKWSIKTL